MIPLTSPEASRGMAASDRLLAPADARFAHRPNPGHPCPAAIRRGLRKTALVALLALAALPTPAHAEDKSGLLRPVAPTLVFLASQLPGSGAPLDAVRRFKATAPERPPGVRRLPAAGSGRGRPGRRSHLPVLLAQRRRQPGRALRHPLPGPGQAAHRERVHQPGDRRRAAQEELHRRGRRGHPDGPPAGGLVVGKVTGTQGVADSTIVCARPAGPGIKEIFGIDRDGRNPRSSRPSAALPATRRWPPTAGWPA